MGMGRYLLNGGRWYSITVNASGAANLPMSALLAALRVYSSLRVSGGCRKLYPLGLAGRQRSRMCPSCRFAALSVTINCRCHGGDTQAAAGSKRR